MESKVPQKVALVGCGWFACEAHLPALKKLEAAGEIEIAALCSLSSASIARGTAILGRSVRTFSSLPELLDAPGIDVVDLTLPIPIMAEAVRASLIAGKHVISEKPCAGSLDAARALVAFHEQLSKPCVWAVAENWRFKRSTRLIQEIVANRVIGDVTSADFKFVTRANGEDAGWRNGGNFPGWLLLDSGVHFIAMLRQVVGEICSVSGNVTKRVVHHAGFDSLAATLRFADGADGMLRMSFSSADAPNRCELELVGTTGTLTADFMASSMTLTVGRRVRTIRFEDDPWIEGGVHDLLAHCFASIRTGVALIPTPREAMSDVAVIEALFEASRSGQRIAPATLPLSAPHVVRSYERLSDFRAKSAIDCNTVDEVRQAVGAAASAGLKIRPRGNCLSWAPHLATRDASITIRGLNRIIRIDEDKRTVQVEAGTRLGHLTRELALHGLTVPSLSFLTDQTIGGAIATATHGTNVSWGTLSDFVESV
ncbi:MAG: hypothetical protein JWO88_3567, partial [Frankiales bacterium]|nr:hypothetical protein [Frankiales bacterium]